MMKSDCLICSSLSDERDIISRSRVSFKFDCGAVGPLGFMSEYNNHTGFYVIAFIST